MKVLFISAYHPPHHLGGYELRIRDIFQELSKSFCDAIFLTTKCSGQCAVHNAESDVFRILFKRNTGRRFYKTLFKDLADLLKVDNRIRKFKPDVVYLGHIQNLSAFLLPFLAYRNIPILYDEGGAGLRYAWSLRTSWCETGHGNYFWAKPLKKLFNILWKWPKNLYVCFNNDEEKEAAEKNKIKMRYSKVIYSGIDNSFLREIQNVKLTTPIRIVCPGRMQQSKGQVDAIYLLKYLRDMNIDTVLTLIGEKYSNDYVTQIFSVIEKFELGQYVHILPMSAYSEMPSVYLDNQICFFSSYQDFGFSRIPLEALASGCIVCSYGNESSNKYLIDNVNGFLIEPQDYQRITKITLDLLHDESKFSLIRKRGHDLIEKQYLLQHYIKKIEDYLEFIVSDIKSL